MILHRLLKSDDDLAVCHLPVDARLWLNIDGIKYVKANQGELVSSDRWKFNAWLIGISRAYWNGSQAVIDVFETTRAYLAETTPEIDGTTPAGRVIETPSHRYMLCVPCKIVEQGSMMIHGWTFPEAI